MKIRYDLYDGLNYMFQSPIDLSEKTIFSVKDDNDETSMYFVEWKHHLFELDINQVTVELHCFKMKDVTS